MQIRFAVITKQQTVTGNFGSRARCNRVHVRRAQGGNEMRKFNTRNAIDGLAMANGEATLCAKSNLPRVSDDAAHVYLRGMSVSTLMGMPAWQSRISDLPVGTKGIGCEGHEWLETRADQVGQRVIRNLQLLQVDGLGTPTAGQPTSGSVVSGPAARFGKS